MDDVYQIDIWVGGIMILWYYDIMRKKAAFLMFQECSLYGCYVLVLLEGDDSAQCLVQIECLGDFLLLAIMIGQLIGGPYI